MKTKFAKIIQSILLNDPNSQIVKTFFFFFFFFKFLGIYILKTYSFKSNKLNLEHSGLSMGNCSRPDWLMMRIVRLDRERGGLRIQQRV
jgi:hypothetical protein